MKKLQGAEHFAQTIRGLKTKKEELLVECLTGDFAGDVDCIRTVADEVLFLDEGQAVVQAEPEEFFNSLHPRLARFFGKEST